MTMMAYVLSKIGASVYAGAVLLEVVTGFSMWASAPLVIVGTALYTAVGGLSVSAHCMWILVGWSLCSIH